MPSNYFTMHQLNRIDLQDAGFGSDEASKEIDPEMLAIQEAACESSIDEGRIVAETIDCVTCHSVDGSRPVEARERNNQGIAASDHEGTPGFPEHLASLYASGRLADREGREVELRASVTLEEARLLYWEIRRIKPDASLEVGMGQGLSTVAILQALEDSGAGHHYVVDPFEQAFDDVGLATVDRAGLNHRMSFHREHLEEVFAQIPPLKFVFIDASHLFDLTLSAFALADRRLSQGGYMGFHDMWLPSQQKVVRYILSNRSYELYPPPERMAISPLVRRHFLSRWLRPEVALPWRKLEGG